MGDLLTLPQYDLPVKIVLFDNSSRATGRLRHHHHQRTRAQRRRGPHDPTRPLQPAQHLTPVILDSQDHLSVNAALRRAGGTGREGAKYAGELDHRVGVHGVADLVAAAARGDQVSLA
ncbi:hypothetical protein [Nonomuraea insulae]|uniref:Thiamine pyrophosphate enzyme TPP-binding domain-containing protein n=1 Tax=Nonomuraea insulae TaxID=1616787 RepID=A0ABW1DAL4_9ACTN